MSEDPMKEFLERGANLAERLHSRSNEVVIDSLVTAIKTLAESVDTILDNDKLLVELVKAAAKGKFDFHNFDVLETGLDEHIGRSEHLRKMIAEMLVPVRNMIEEIKR